MNCPRCGVENSSLGITQIEPILCEGCGKEFPSLSKNYSPFALVRNYFHDVWEISIHPKQFFQRMALSGGLARPLAFALVTHWIGATLGAFWQSLTQSTLMRLIQKLGENDSQFAYFSRASQFSGSSHLAWILRAGPVVIDPFLTLFSILFSSFLVFMGARILVNPGKDGHPNEITYESAVKLISYGLSPSLLAGVPLLGGFLAAIWVLIVTVQGAKSVYRIPTGRAIVIAIFPKLIFVAFLATGLVLFLSVFFKLFMSFVGN